MKLNPKSKISLRQLKSGKKNSPTIQYAAPHPDQFKCKVNGPDGKSVALVPICLPLSIMASYAVKAAGGSDEVACMASVAVVHHGNTIVNDITPDTILNDKDSLGYIDTVARHTRETLLRKIGDEHIASEVENMIRGGGELILNGTNQQEDDACDETRDDEYDEDSRMIGDDVQTIATSVLNNYDEMTNESFPVVSQYETNESAAQISRRSLDTSVLPSYASTFQEHSITSSPGTNPVFGWNALLPACTSTGYASTQMTSTTGPVSMSQVINNHHLLAPSQTKSLASTWNASHNGGMTTMTNETSLYAKSSTFNMDTFAHVPPEFYKTDSQELEGCPNLSIEPAFSDDNMMDGNDDILVAVKANSRGILAVASDTNVVSSITDEAMNGNLAGSQPNPYTNRSITTNSIQSKGGCCNIFGRCQDFGVDVEHKDQMTLEYQSVIELGMEVDDLTTLNSQSQNSSQSPPKKKKSRLNRLKSFFNCKSSD
jgi:hypothetical protein